LQAWQKSGIQKTVIQKDYSSSYRLVANIYYCTSLNKSRLLTVTPRLEKSVSLPAAIFDAFDYGIIVLDKSG